MENKFGEYLKELRTDRKLTLRDVEEQAQISNAYLSQVERGQRGTPTMKILVKLAEVYGVPVSVLNEKAEAELKLTAYKAGLAMTMMNKNKQKIPTTLLGAEPAKQNIPAPDTEFICRGYENLSEEKKQTLKNFLQYLQDEKKKKK